MISIPQKPNSSSIFTGRKDILEKLANIFVPRADPSLMSRRSCLLWGMGGIGKTQICLKFMEEMSDR
jgi:GTPase SAR1 family protein